MLAVDRIVVVGNSGSGKTTVSREIGARLGLPVLEMDSVYHQENWQPLPDDEFRNILSEFITQDGWVVDGNYSRLGTEEVLWPRADTIVWLDTGRLITTWRVFKRTVSRSAKREELWAGNRERLRNLAKRNIKVSPHVVAGLHYGEIAGEYKALEIISRYDIASLVLVVLTPMCYTPMAEVVPPSLEEMKEIFTIAREMFPDTPILLGCARPAGKYRLELDKAALDIGLDGIAYPSEGMGQYATEKGLTPVFSEYCCSFIFEEE